MTTVRIARYWTTWRARLDDTTPSRRIGPLDIPAGGTSNVGGLATIRCTSRDARSHHNARQRSKTLPDSSTSTHALRILFGLMCVSALLWSTSPAYAHSGAGHAQPVSIAPADNESAKREIVALDTYYDAVSASSAPANYVSPVRPPHGHDGMLHDQCTGDGCSGGGLICSGDVTVERWTAVLVALGANHVSSVAHRRIDRPPQHS